MDVTADEDDDGLRTINLKKIWPILSRSVVRDVAPVTHVQLDKVFFSWSKYGKMGIFASFASWPTSRFSTASRVSNLLRINYRNSITL